MEIPYLDSYLSNGEKSIHTHVDSMYGLLTPEQGGSPQNPIIFIASCFGGLIVVQVCFVSYHKLSMALFGKRGPMMMPKLGFGKIVTGKCSEI